MNKLNVPFCLPLIDKYIAEEINDALFNKGWITTGPKVNEFELEIKKLTDSDQVLCVNSWHAGVTLIMKWLGLKAGDEVIVPSYTYSATAMCPINMGLTVKMIDVDDKMQISLPALKQAITDKTKLIMPVDIGGRPCDYDLINEIVKSNEITSLFKPNNLNQKKLGRIFILSDAAHSIGSIYKNKSAATYSDASVFSFHSVKNITTGEGGAVCLNLPKVFRSNDVIEKLRCMSIYGQSKSALMKNKRNQWRYDIIEEGQKCNMTDVVASIGLSQIRRYNNLLLPERKQLFNNYNSAFNMHDNIEIPIIKDDKSTSACHLYQLKLHGFNEIKRDRIIQQLGIYNIGASVHYIPMPSFTFFKALGYNIKDYPNTQRIYSITISLPLYNGLTEIQQEYVIEKFNSIYLKQK